jgi:hypothetical protein
VPFVAFVVRSFVVDESSCLQSPMLEQTLSAHFSASDWLLPPHPDRARTASGSASPTQINAGSRLIVRV